MDGKGLTATSSTRAQGLTATSSTCAQGLTATSSVNENAPMQKFAPLEKPQELPPDPPSEIDVESGRLFLGGVDGVGRDVALKVIGNIDFILSIGCQFRDPPKTTEVVFTGLFGDNHNSEYEITRCIDTYLESIDEHLNKGHTVFVHCAMGISRSATIVIAYFMKKFASSWNCKNGTELYKKAFQFVRLKRDIMSKFGSVLIQFGDEMLA